MRSWVNSRDVKNVPGRPKTDKLDAVWLAKLTEKGLLRPSFVPPTPIRVLRDYTRLREDLIRERTRYWQRRAPIGRFGPRADENQALGSDHCARRPLR